VGNTAELLAAVAAVTPRSAAVIGVQRGTQALELTIVVAQRPLPHRREPG
jgi:hypothetical protein